MKYSSLLILFFLSLSNVLSSQITGLVVDQNNTPIVGAYVSNTNKNEHSHTDHRGRYAIKNTSIGDTLISSHIGYAKKWLVVQSLQGTQSFTLQTKLLSINEVVISPKLDALNLFTDIDIKANPVNSSQDILQKVPGLFIGQHAGGGKAEQIFLRGFDIDHGTDINISVDGMPVNMVSHAHGQGYADLHFVIPETIEKINFGKGTYYADKGNFTTAGYVAFKTKDQLTKNELKIERGQFNSKRILGMFNLLNTQKNKAYFATEYISFDGPFESPQNFNRMNLLGKYTGFINDTDKISIQTSHFTSTWDASGQIPTRSVKNNSIGRFGAIDATEGGTTSRTNFAVNHHKYIDENSSIKNTVYYSKYDFELYSNFTFFLEDPVNGDQIKQKESRDLFGIKSEYTKQFETAKIEGNWKIGLELRNDKSKNNELAHTLNRKETLTQIQFGNINETNYGLYADATFEVGKFTLNPGIRFDNFEFNYQNDLEQNYSTQSQTGNIVSPKFNILYNPSEKTQWYLKTGKGFHSNDTRVVVAQNGKKTLPAAYSADLGFIWKPNEKTVINTALWNLYLEQEFVYVGDAGIVEPSGETNRKGIDVSIRRQLLPWLLLNFDTNYTLARSIEEAEGENYIPLAPDFTLAGGLQFERPNGIYGGINVRHLGDRAANDDNSIVAQGYTITDITMGLKWKKLNFGIQVQNVFDVEWNETQFATSSQLKNESVAVEEIHFTPGTPFFLKASIAYNF